MESGEDAVNNVKQIKFNDSVLISSVNWIRPFIKCLNKNKEKVK